MNKLSESQRIEFGEAILTNLLYKTIANHIFSGIYKEGEQISKDKAIAVWKDVSRTEYDLDNKTSAEIIESYINTENTLLISLLDSVIHPDNIFEVYSPLDSTWESKTDSLKSTIDKAMYRMEARGYVPVRMYVNPKHIHLLHKMQDTFTWKLQSQAIMNTGHIGDLNHTDVHENWCIPENRIYLFSNGFRVGQIKRNSIIVDEQEIENNTEIAILEDGMGISEILF